MDKNKNTNLITSGDYAHFRHAMTESGWTSDRFGFEIFHGAIQANATTFKVSVTDRHDNSSIKVINYWNNGETPEESLLTGRMLNFNPPEDNEKTPNAISKRTIGFKKESHRAGCWISRSIPGSDGYVKQMNFSYYKDYDGTDLITEDEYTFEMFQKARSMRWELVETDIPNDELFPSGSGLLFTNYVFEDGPIDINIEQMQKNLTLYHSECNVDMEFYDMDKLLPRTELRHRVMNEHGELLRSVREFKLCGDILVVKYKNKTIKFRVKFAHRLMKKPDRINYSKFEKLIKNFIEYKIKGKRYGAPLLSLIGPRNIILSVKDGHDWWDKHQEQIGSDGEKINKWNYEKYQGLEVFLEPLQDISDYFSNVKTDGLTDSKLDDMIEQEMAVFIKQRDEFISPYFEVSKKEEDSFVDQFKAAITGKSQDSINLRNSFSTLDKCFHQINTKKSNWPGPGKKLGGREIDLQALKENVLFEFQNPDQESDLRHCDGIASRLNKLCRNTDKWETFIWIAKRHDHINELRELMEGIDWSKNTSFRAVYFLEAEEALKGFDANDIESIKLEDTI